VAHIYRYLKRPADIWRGPQISEDASRYLEMPGDICLAFRLGLHHLKILIFE